MNTAGFLCRAASVAGIVFAVGFSFFKMDEAVTFLLVAPVAALLSIAFDLARIAERKS